MLVTTVMIFQGFNGDVSYNNEPTNIELTLPDEEYINDIPFDTKEVVDSLNQS